MNDRAYFITPIYKGCLRKKLVGYLISDGHNDVKIDMFGYFLIDTNEPITTRIIRSGM